SLVSGLNALNPRPTLFPYTTLFRSLDWTQQSYQSHATAKARSQCQTSLYEAKSGGVRENSEVTADGHLGTATNCFAFNQSNRDRSEEHTSELQSRFDLVCRLLLEKK